MEAGRKNPPIRVHPYGLTGTTEKFFSSVAYVLASGGESMKDVSASAAGGTIMSNSLPMEEGKSGRDGSVAPTEGCAW